MNEDNKNNNQKRSEIWVFILQFNSGITVTGMTSLIVDWCSEKPMLMPKMFFNYPNCQFITSSFGMWILWDSTTKTYAYEYSLTCSYFAKSRTLSSGEDRSPQAMISQLWIFDPRELINRWVPWPSSKRWPHLCSTGNALKWGNSPQAVEEQWKN